MLPSLLYDLAFRVIIIIAVTDGLIFYLMSKGYARIRKTMDRKFGYGMMAFLVIVVTLIPLLINIWFVLWRYGLLTVGG
jgi:hypothetical protein